MIVFHVILGGGGGGGEEEGPCGKGRGGCRPFRDVNYAF